MALTAKKNRNKIGATMLATVLAVGMSPAVPAFAAGEAAAPAATAADTATATAATDNASVTLADGTYEVPVASGYGMFKIQGTSTVVLKGSKATVTVTTDGADPQSLDGAGNPKYDALYIGRATVLNTLDKSTVPVVEGVTGGKSVAFTFDTTRADLNSGVYFVARYAKTYVSQSDFAAGKTVSAAAGTWSGMGGRTGKITDYAFTFGLKDAKRLAVEKAFTVNASTVSASALKSAAQKAYATTSSATSVTVGAKAKKISKGAFKSFGNVKTVTIKSTKLTKKSVKGSLSGSKVTTVKVPKSKKAAYKKIFTKANAGKKVTVK